MKHTIDAQGKKLGRVASQAAALLMGKDTVTFQRHIAPKVTVEIINASKADLDAKKREQTTYARYSGFPGGLRHENMNDIIKKKGYSELFHEAVHGMLPKNKLRPIMIKNLVISE